MSLSPDERSAVSNVRNVLEAHAGSLPADSPVAVMFRDWMDLLEGRPLPWAIPWDFRS